jgi:hypothetical protein
MLACRFMSSVSSVIKEINKVLMAAITKTNKALCSPAHIYCHREEGTRMFLFHASVQETGIPHVTDLKKELCCS